MLDQAIVTANIPAADLARARSFYADRLGLTVAEEVGGVALLYRAGGDSWFTIYQTEYAGQAGHTIAQFHVDDVADVVRDLHANDVAFEHYDLPGVEWDGDVASMSGVGKAAWFKDSEGNVMCIDDARPAAVT